MSTWAVLPVKSFGRAKTRTRLHDPERADLAERMAGDVLRALAEVRGLAGVLVVTREPRVALLADDVVPDPDETGHSAAALLGIEEALARGARRVLLVPGDCPLMDATEVEALLDFADAGVTIVPDRHGTGTNALVLDPPDVMAPAFGPGSFARHAALARAAGAAVRVRHVPSLAFDVDTPDDVAALAAA
ncbi:MAG: 2-phospho-L-lactate/phosphoenolpyruvate guanylyltransferase [Solirubrobacteraceae bacterium]|jgi:2-phospho-L-lactate guanylyltransferase|nr:2-phospho-L-lactate/phosphoenolpyruvate guanylyltransferase [Solirubrobacteraceae bacterium]